MEPANKQAHGDALHQLVERIKRIEREIERQERPGKRQGFDNADSEPTSKAYLETLRRLKEDYLAQLRLARATKLPKRGK